MLRLGTETSAQQLAFSLELCPKLFRAGKLQLHVTIVFRWNIQFLVPAGGGLYSHCSSPFPLDAVRMNSEWPGQACVGLSSWSFFCLASRSIHKGSNQRCCCLPKLNRGYIFRSARPNSGWRFTCPSVLGPKYTGLKNEVLYQ